MIRKTAMLVLVLLVALPVAAGRLPVDETRPAAADGEVSVELLAGSVNVVAWERNEVSVSGSINDEYEELQVYEEGGDVSIEVEILEGEHRNAGRGAELEIRVPSGSRLEIEAVSSDITVESVRGEVSIEAVSGTIELRGEIEEIDIECVSGEVSIKTTADLRRAQIETVSGNVDLRASLSHDARLSLESVNGNVTLRLPSSVSAQFDVETFNGDIENDFGPRARKSSEYLPAQELSFSTGSGDARVTVESFNGRVRLVAD